MERLKPQIYNKVCSRKQRCKLYLLMWPSCGQQRGREWNRLPLWQLEDVLHGCNAGYRVYGVENTFPSSCLPISLCSNLSLADPKQGIDKFSCQQMQVLIASVFRRFLLFLIIKGKKALLYELIKTHLNNVSLWWRVLSSCPGLTGSHSPGSPSWTLLRPPSAPPMGPALWKLIHGQCSTLPLWWVLWDMLLLQH